MNKVIIMGNVTKDPRITYTPTQMCIARFTVALNRGKDKDGEDNGADFPNCVAFGKSAELIDKYVHKGDKICIEGRIQTGSYEKDGRTVYTTDIVVERLEFAGGKKADKPEEPTDGFTRLSEDDIPF